MLFLKYGGLTNFRIYKITEKVKRGLTEQYDPPSGSIARQVFIITYLTVRWDLVWYTAGSRKNDTVGTGLHVGNI